MKKLFFVVVAIICVLPILTKAEIIYNGSDLPGGTGSGNYWGCDGVDYAWCRYDNIRHMTVAVSLYHFNGGGKSPDKYGNTITFTNSSWVNNKFGINYFNKAYTNYSINNSNGVNGYSSSGLKQYFTNVQAFNETIKKITGAKDLNEYAKTYASIYKKNFHAPFGGEYGWRLVIEPYFTYVKTWNRWNEQWALMSAKDVARNIMAKVNAGNKDIRNLCTSWDNKDGVKYMTALFTTNYDVGVEPPGNRYGNLSSLGNNSIYDMGWLENYFRYAASSLVGFGYNIVVPPYEVKGKEPCNPDKKGIKTCCMDEKISPTNTKNNTLEYLTRILSFKEINENCGNPGRCDPDLGGHGQNVKKCCDEFNIKRDNLAPNTYEYLMRPLTQDEIDYICDPICKYQIDIKMTEDCTKSKVGYIKDFDNWSCIFKSKKTIFDEVKTHYLVFNNNYCAIYCEEEINYNFPDESAKTEAGRYLTIEKTSIGGLTNAINPIKINDKKNCRTTSKIVDMTTPGVEPDGIINKTKFINDLNNAPNEQEKRRIQSAYDACTTGNNIPLNIDPKITFKYMESYYKGAHTLSKKSSTRSFVRKYHNGGSAVNNTGSVSTVPNIVNHGNISYNNATWVEFTIIDELYYGLPLNLYRYIDKITGQASTTSLGSNAIDLGFSNLPVHFSTIPGKYNFEIEIEELAGAGKQSHKFTKYLKGSKTFAGIMIEGLKQDYKCSFNVTCSKPIVISNCEEWTDACKKPYCEKGITPKFRFIALGTKKKAFPGQNGLGRLPGPNWNNNILIDLAITNNRGVKDYNIYKLKPMYEIKLTPSLMKTIRKYNKQMNSKKVTIYNNAGINQTGIGGYVISENFRCTKNGGECQSGKIRSWGVKGCAIGEYGHNQSNCGNTKAWGN
ncbi:MAG: hypothetical protein RR557_03955 [Bacilli bacterium]